MINKEKVFSIALVFLFLISISSTALAKETTVDHDSEADFRSIQEAVTSSFPGDTVIMRPGTYKEKFVVNVNGLTIRPESGRDGTCYSPYYINGNGFDYLPLVSMSIPQKQVLPIGYFSTNTMKGLAPFFIQFTYLLRNAISRGLDFNNNGIADSRDTRPFYVYAAPEKYAVDLTVSNENGAESKFAKIIVQGEPGFPVADFSANVTSGYAPLSVQFTDSSQNATGWNWDFGDEANSTVQNPTHTYTEAGNYAVNLTVKNENGTNSKTLKIIADEAPNDDKVLPVADFSANVTSGYAPLSVQFTDSSQNTTEWNWDFGDEANSTEQNPTHTYTEAGNYAVNLTVKNENGTNSKTLKIIADEAPNDDKVLPVADFKANITSGYAPLSVQFTDSSQNATEWNWNFGDGATSTDQNPIHTYYAVGALDVNLTVKNENGTDSKTFKIIVDEAPIKDKVLQVADFNANVTSGYAPLYVQFTDLSENEAEWKWNFGDGNASINRNPMHTYFTEGNYAVNLTVNNENGTDSKTIEIIVHKAPSKDKVLPEANFTANVTSGYAPLYVLFTDLSGNATSWSWDFNNDGINESSDLTPVYVYTTPGTYIAKLTVSNENGTASKTAEITAKSQSSGSGGGNGGSGGSGGSGGGGGGSPEPPKNVEVKEISQAFVTSGNPAKFDFTKNATSIVYVSFDAKKTAGKTTTIIEMLKGISTLVSELPFGEVYKSLNIWVGDSGFGTSKNIENSVVCFKVEKSWLDDKNIDRSSITLNRYSDKKWNQLPTSLSGEDERYLYFTAKTPGFSPFAITGNNETFNLRLFSNLLCNF
jgi:PGF-pre-PGF domain-containing protein